MCIFVYTLIRKKKILVCPLDWGLGHATRMVPVIKSIERNGGDVILAADNRPFDFLKQHFPKNKIIRLAGFSPRYPSKGSMALTVARSFPKMVKQGITANNELKKIVAKNEIDAIISDNRYELALPTIPSIFITHQLNIRTTGWQNIGKPIINLVLSKYLKDYSEIWIPDIDGNHNLSGNLSKSNRFKEKTSHIGLLSRFSENDISTKSNKIDLLVILSGPEPQRTILEKLLIKQAIKTNLKTIILQGKPEETKSTNVKNIKLIPHVNDNVFASLMQSASYIISRPGYSTLMDLATIGCNSIFIPTPGQTEQEYLAKTMKVKGIAYSESQKDFDLSNAIEQSKGYKGFSLKNNSKLLEERIMNLLKIC